MVDIASPKDVSIQRARGQTSVLTNHTIQRCEPFLKRPFDIFLSSIGLLFSAWFWVLIWVLVIIEDGHPVFIKQIRVGKNGKPFNCWKFRSMKKLTLSEEVNQQAAEHDTRITRIGKFLRGTALDELPQLLNIFIGDMSFVGPRPLLYQELEVDDKGSHCPIGDIPGYHARISVRPGLTGFAQVYARRDIVRRYKFKYDSIYVQKMGFLLDISLILISILVTITGNWEKHTPKLDVFERRKSRINEYTI